jgi:sensor histidine kinase YesM
LNFTLKNAFSGRKFYILGIIFIVLTLLSIYILSNLITQITEKTNSESAQRNFIKRQEVIAQEFSSFLQTEKELERVIAMSPTKNLSNNLRVFNTILADDDLIKNSWFQINDDEIEFTSSKGDSNTVNSIKDFIANNRIRDRFNVIVKDKQNFSWRIYFKFITKNGDAIRYGYDIDLKSLQSFFYTVNQNIPNYAFVFDEKGTILYHPEVEFLEQNAFKITNLTPSDTIFKNDESFTSKTGLSEYLKLDIVRYTKRLNVKDTNWYISVSTPQKISNEDVDAVKKYASLIYLIATAILLIFFYLFTLFNRKSYQEKEALSKEKANLLLENERINSEKTLIQLQQLKEQINPHFLFNSLNSLYMLINSSTSLARKFTINLSKIYRYLINPPVENIVTLKEELHFIEKYIFLQQTRFKDEFAFKVIIEDVNALSKKVPYLSFQIAVENAIKHNIASEENPLEIRIIIKENRVIITNNLNEKPNFDGESKFGLKYLESIYGYYSKSDFETFKKDGFFFCILPLIE